MIALQFPHMTQTTINIMVKGYFPFQMTSISNQQLLINNLSQTHNTSLQTQTHFTTSITHTFLPYYKHVDKRTRTITYTITQYTTWRTRSDSKHGMTWLYDIT